VFGPWTLALEKKGPWILGNEMKVDFRNEGQETESKISARPRGLGRLDGVNAPIPLVAFFPAGDWASSAALHQVFVGPFTGDEHPQDISQ